jgi:RimJ/RimL family protein N-acetyltransferase
MRQHPVKKEKTFAVREATMNDADAVRNVVNNVASERIYVVPESATEDWKQTFREIKKRKGSIVVACVNGKIVGMAYVVGGKFEKDSHVGFLGISILKEHRGIGIGTAMMEHIMEWSRNHARFEKISLAVFSTNDSAISLYRKFGFRTEGRSRKQYKIEGKYVDEITMGKFLT